MKLYSFTFCIVYLITSNAIALDLGNLAKDMANEMVSEAISDVLVEREHPVQEAPPSPVKKTQNQNFNGHGPVNDDESMNFNVTVSSNVDCNVWFYAGLKFLLPKEWEVDLEGGIIARNSYNVGSIGKATKHGVVTIKHDGLDGYITVANLSVEDDKQVISSVDQRMTGKVTCNNVIFPVVKTAESERERIFVFEAASETPIEIKPFGQHRIYVVGQFQNSIDRNEKRIVRDTIGIILNSAELATFQATPRKEADAFNETNQAVKFKSLFLGATPQHVSSVLNERIKDLKMVVTSAKTGKKTGLAFIGGSLMDRTYFEKNIIAKFEDDSMTYLRIQEPYLGSLYPSINDLHFDEFVQLFVDSYNIPEMTAYRDIRQGILGLKVNGGYEYKSEAGDYLKIGYDHFAQFKTKPSDMYLKLELIASKREILNEFD